MSKILVLSLSLFVGLSLGFKAFPGENDFVNPGSGRVGLINVVNPGQIYMALTSHERGFKGIYLYPEYQK